MKLGLVFIFSENDKLKKEAKIQLINFIEGANEYQLKALALDGAIARPDQLDEQACSILDDRFAASFDIQDKLKEASFIAMKEAGAATHAAMGMAAGAGIAATAMAGKKMLQRRKCKKQFPNDPKKYKQCVNK